MNNRHPILFLVILTLMSMAGLIGSDVYLPTLPDIATALNRDQHSMQLTLSIYLLGLSVGQLFLGPITDRFGRKKLLIIGMMIYMLASLSCALTTNYYQLLLLRLFQALGASSGLVIGRAIVGDLFDAKQAGRVFATIFPFVGMSPAISPVIGGVIGYHFGWEATFIFVMLFALSILLLSCTYLDETLKPEHQKPLRFMNVLATYPRVFTNRTFIFYASAPCIAYIAYFAYIAQSPFILHAHGFNEQAIGFFYISLSVTYVVGSLWGRKLLQTKSLDQALKQGYSLFALGGLMFAISGVFFDESITFMLVSISLLTLGNGFLIPLGTAGVVSSFAGSVGYASGLLGFLQLGVAALTTSWINIISHNQVDRLGLFIGVVTSCGFMMHFYIKKAQACASN